MQASPGLLSVAQGWSKGGSRVVQGGTYVRMYIGTYLHTIAKKKEKRNMGRFSYLLAVGQLVGGFAHGMTLFTALPLGVAGLSMGRG